MNQGIISSRYARAFLKYTEETGNSEKVCAQVRTALSNPDKMSTKLEPELEKFAVMLKEKGRMPLLRDILRLYVVMYHQLKGIKIVKLSTAVPSPQLESKLLSILEKQFCCKVDFETCVDPSLIGGFLLTIDDYLLDASVRNQIEKIRKEFVKQHNRLV